MRASTSLTRWSTSFSLNQIRAEMHDWTSPLTGQESPERSGSDHPVEFFGASIVTSIVSKTNPAGDFKRTRNSADYVAISCRTVQSVWLCRGPTAPECVLRWPAILGAAPRQQRSARASGKGRPAAACQHDIKKANSLRTSNTESLESEGLRGKDLFMTSSHDRPRMVAALGRIVVGDLCVTFWPEFNC